MQIRGLTYFKWFTVITLVGLSHTLFAQPNRVPATIRGAAALSEQDTISADLLQAYNDVKSRRPDFDATMIVPTEAQGLPADVVMKKMADKTISMWWSTSQVKESSWGSRAEKVEKNMTQDVVLSKSKKIEHKLTFQFLPMQTTAQMNYTGLLNARFFIEAKDSLVGLEFKEKLTERQDLAVVHKINNIDRVSQVNYVINW